LREILNPSNKTCKNGKNYSVHRPKPDFSGSFYYFIWLFCLVLFSCVCRLVNKEHDDDKLYGNISET